MIEIKNKRMILFREDRLIGAAGDVDTSKRKFILDALQGECDLSKMVAWIKIDPKVPGEDAYDQLLKKEIFEDKIILTWNLSARNLVRAGEISAQIIFASPEYFLEDDFENILDNIPLVPSPVIGSSAPVWQSYPETFVIEESIVETGSYKELTKNVLVAAVAESISASEASQAAAETAGELASSMVQVEQSVADMNDEIRKTYERVEGLYDACLDGVQSADESTQLCRDYVELSARLQDETLEAKEKALKYVVAAENAADVAIENAEKTLSAVKKASDYRLIYKKTLSAEDSDCYSFEITQDAEGNEFSLSEFTMFLYIPMMPNTATSYLQIFIKPDDPSVSTYQSLGQYSAISKTKEMYVRSEHKNMGRWVTKIARGSSWVQNIESLNVTSSVASGTRKTDGKGAQAIRINQSVSGGEAFPEGTMVEIWGVNAVKEAE